MDVDTATERFVEEGREVIDSVDDQYIKSDFQIRWAKVWAVDPTRGDIFVVSVSEGTNQFVTVSNAIVNDPRRLMNTQMKVLCNGDGHVIGMPIEGSDRFNACTQMPAPPLHVFCDR